MTIEQFRIIKPPGDYKKDNLLTDEEVEFIESSRQKVCKILCGNDPRIVVILGPCSIHNEKSALEYAERLKSLQEKVKDSMLLVMRFYFEKPRTKTGWKVILYDPHLNGSDELEEGLAITRKLMTQITRMGVPLAAEIVDPIGFYYFSDLLSWLCIGARTSSSQVHRQNTSRMSMAVGFKNDLSGDITNAINSIVASDSSHTFMGINDDGRVGIYQSEGSPFGHLVLRGSKNKPNYRPEDVNEVVNELAQSGLISSLVVDCSHDNCDKNHEKMPEVFESVIKQIIGGNVAIRGAMLESHLLPGNQSISGGFANIDPRISITDACIGWEKTTEIIEKADQLISEMIHARHG